MRLFIQVLDENSTCKFDARIVDVPEEMFYAPDATVMSLECVKTAIDFHLFRRREAAEISRR